ncbi:MAG: T9SS type A sorting domain-containing protein, partial [Chitinophagaceae bacterium]|nr:T9SS type A sorting domain-containing protein [Chitinophagaceae bacterium]
SGITFTAAGGNGVTWNTAIKTAALFNGSTFIATASSITATNIVFSGLSISVADNSSATYSLRISLNETLGTGNDDGKYFIFQLSQANITTVADGTSSSTTNFTAITTASGGTENKIDIVATKLYFVQQPTASTTFNDISPAVKVHATDANNNIDSNYTTNVQITATGAVLRNSPVTQTTVGGLSTFSGLQFATPGTGVTLTATSGSLTNAVSNGFNITLGSPIVALAQWTFETSVPTSAGPHSPEIGSGQATGNHASGSTTYNNPVGNGSAESFSSDRWASGDYYQFKTSSYGYQNITIDFDQTGSNTGPRDFKIQYSTDGSTFTDLSGGSYQLTADSWSSSGDPKSASSRTFDLSSVTALNNQANIYIRLTVSSSTAIDGGSIATTGTGRVDNVTIKGAAITFTWNGAGDGVNWNDAANWDCNCGLTPTMNNPVVIPNGANVVLNTDYTARNLQLQSTSSLKVAPNKTLTVEGVADFNGQHVTIQSDATGTGMIGQVSGFIEDANNVTVERYISASGNRAYRLLTPSVTTSNYIRDNWQEGTNNPDVATNNNPNPGYGTHITGAGGSSNGFDPTQNNQVSLYKLVTNAWVAVSNTNSTILEADKAYLLFVRGSRDNINTINTLTGSSNTTLRATGTIKQGGQTFSSLPASSFSLVTNPYPSPLNWGSVYTANSSNFENYVYIWDPNIGVRGGYVAVEDDGTTSVASALTQNLQSGQAFFVRTKSGIASLAITEADKASVNNLNVYKTSETAEKLNIQLRFTKDGKDVLADGVLARFASNYNNVVDGNDAIQITNWDEDIALVRNSSNLSIESRNTISAADTLFLKMANLRVAQGTYNWIMAPTNFNNNNLQAYLEDAFTGTRKSISLIDTNRIAFTVSNNVASTASNRFRIVFAERKIYYSKSNNSNANELSSWSSTTDGNGTPPTSFNELANFVVQQGHTLQLADTLHLTEGTLTIKPNAEINNNGLLSVAYNIENNGTVSGNGLLQLNGSIKQYFTGYGTYSKVELDNSNGAEIFAEAQVNITTAYKPTNGILTTNNNLVFKSSAQKTASISSGNTTGNYINGNITLETYVPAKAVRKWSFISSPLTQSIANGWQQQIHITGAGTGGSVCPTLLPHNNGFDATLTNASNIYTYDASKASGQRWAALPTTTTDFTNAGKAFRINIRGNRNLGCSLLDGTINAPSEVTVTTTGLLNNEAKNAGNFSIEFANNGVNNYVLIGNPYPSAISFSSLYSQNSTSINNNYALYIPTNNAGVYTYWDGLTNTFTGGVGYDDITGNNIATAQAVFVQSAVAGNIVLHFSENIKTEENATAYFKNNSVKEKIKINYLNSSGNKIDETVVRFISDNAVTNNEVGRLDIPSINTGSFIATIKNSTQLAVHSRALNNLISDEVWLNIGASQTGNYTLHFSDYQTLEDADIFLEDHYLNTKQNIKLNDNYSFSVDVNNAATKGSARFSLVFIRTAPSEVVYNQIKMYPNPADKQVSLLLPKGIDNGINYQIKLTDITGKIVIQRKAKGGKEVIDIASLTAGIYIVEITDSKGKRVTEKLVKN